MLTKFIITIFTACVAIVLCDAESSITAISRTSPRNIAPKAIIEGITDCGVGRLINVRFGSCTKAPCQISKGNVETLEVDFTPRDHHWIMVLRAVLHKETELETLADGALPDSTITPGTTYTFKFPFQIPTSISGLANIRLELHENWAQEVCLIIPVNVV